MGLRKPKSIKHNGTSLADILEAHERFFSGKDGGVRADLTGADLSHADLSGANLSGTILRNANLEGSDLRKAKLPGADLSGANLRKADLRNTDMTEAVLPGADLTEAQASGVEFFSLRPFECGFPARTAAKCKSAIGKCERRKVFRR